MANILFSGSSFAGNITGSGLSSGHNAYWALAGLEHTARYDGDGGASSTTFSDATWQCEFTSSQHIWKYTFGAAFSECPKDWILEGSNDAGSTWTTIDERIDEPAFVSKTFEASDPGDYDIIRFRWLEGHTVRIAIWRLVFHSFPQAPTFDSAVVQANGKDIVLTLDTTTSVYPPVGLESFDIFKVVGGIPQLLEPSTTVTATRTASNQITLHLTNNTIVDGDEIRIVYTPGNITDEPNDNLASFAHGCTILSKSGDVGYGGEAPYYNGRGDHLFDGIPAYHAVWGASTDSEIVLDLGDEFDIISFGMHFGAYTGGGTYKLYESDALGTTGA